MIRFPLESTFNELTEENYILQVLDVDSTKAEQKADHSSPSKMEVLQTSNSKGKFLLTPVGSRLRLAFLIISWWVLHRRILPAAVRSLTQVPQHQKHWMHAWFPHDTWPRSLCVYVSTHNAAEILHKHYHQSSFSEENEHSMSLCLGCTTA